MKDYLKTDFCNKRESESFAIEPEVSSDFYNDSLYHLECTHESGSIYEITGLHHENERVRMECHDDIKEFYDEKFPVGSDSSLSGGTHFLLFGDYTEYHHKYKELKYKVLNCPLFCKIKENTLYSRYIYSWASFGGGNYVEYGSKSDFVSLKTSLYTNDEDCEGVPIEFRCNNVFDSRILGYYQGILLAVKHNVKFKKMGDDVKNFCKRGDDESYGGDDISLDEINGIELTTENLTILRVNIKRILKLLRENELEESAKALKEYLNEKGIKYI